MTEQKTDIYRVCAPYVTLRSKAETGGEQVLSYFAGAIVPESVDLEDLARHIRKGMVEKVEGDELKAVKTQQADEEKAAEKVEAVEDKEGAAAVKAAQAEADTKAEAEKAAEKAAEKPDDKPDDKPVDKALPAPPKAKGAGS